MTQGYYLGNGWIKIPKEVSQRAKESALDRWMLLLQLDTVECGDFELMFGDCGAHLFLHHQRGSGRPPLLTVYG